MYCCGHAPGMSNMNMKYFSREIIKVCLNPFQENKSESLVTDSSVAEQPATYNSSFRKQFNNRQAGSNAAFSKSNTNQFQLAEHLSHQGCSTSDSHSCTTSFSN